MANATTAITNMPDIPDKCNLIVNYLPQTLSDQEFYELFALVGKTTSTRIIRDKNTNYSFGYGFVSYETPEDAKKAIEQLNGQAIQHKKIKVAYSQPSGSQTKNINLHVSGLPTETTDDAVREVFKPYGSIVQCRVVKDRSSGQGQGFGFVLFTSREEALSAMKGLTGSLFPGTNDNILQVKFAKTEQKGPPTTYLKRMGGQQANYAYNNGMMGNAYGGGMMGGRGGMGMRGRGGGAMRGRGGGPMRGHSFLGRYSPMAATGTYSTVYPNIAAAGDSKYMAPPKETIVFVYGIGPETDENQLWQMFGEYGNISKVNVIWDHVKGVGKGYGFVTFTSYNEAAYAIQHMNGATHEGRTLQVSIKT